MWPESGVLKASHSAAAPRNGVYAATAGHVHLEGVHRAGLQQPFRSKRSQPYSPAAISTPGGPWSRTSRSPVQVVGGDRLLHPRDAPLARRTSTSSRGPPSWSRRRWRPRRAATSSPMACRAAATRSRSSSGSRPTFIFTIHSPSSAQPPSCSADFVRTVGGEAAAAVRRHGLVHPSQEGHQGHAQETGLQVPQRHVHRGQGATRRGRGGPRCAPRGAWRATRPGGDRASMPTTTSASLP